MKKALQWAIVCPNCVKGNETLIHEVRYLKHKKLIRKFMLWQGDVMLWRLLCSTGHIMTIMWSRREVMLRNVSTILMFWVTSWHEFCSRLITRLGYMITSWQGLVTPWPMSIFLETYFLEYKISSPLSLTVKTISLELRNSLGENTFKSIFTFTKPSDLQFVFGWKTHNTILNILFISDSNKIIWKNITFWKVRSETSCF